MGKVEAHLDRCAREVELPSLREIASDLTRIGRVRLIWSLLLPFLWAGGYFLFASWRLWPVAVSCLVCLSFVTYGSISHDLVHANLGLSKWLNGLLLSGIELMALRSGHAYRMAHLHHHALYPHVDDIEGAAAGMSLMRSLLEGVIFQFKIWRWAVKQGSQDRGVILVEGFACFGLIVFALASAFWTPMFLVYVSLMIMGSWIIPLVTSYIPHDPSGVGELRQTRLFRGRMASLVAVEHLYHLEHHLYPAVPHHHWPALAKRLDPYFEKAGIQPIKFWF